MHLDEEQPHLGAAELKGSSCIHTSHQRSGMPQCCAYVQGIEKHGVGRWREIGEELLPQWDDTALRVKTTRLLGSQSLARYIGWKGDRWHEHCTVEPCFAVALKPQDRHQGHAPAGQPEPRALYRLEGRQACDAFLPPSMYDSCMAELRSRLHGFPSVPFCKQTTAPFAEVVSIRYRAAVDAEHAANRAIGDATRCWKAGVLVEDDAGSVAAALGARDAAAATNGTPDVAEAEMQDAVG